MGEREKLEQCPTILELIGILVHLLNHIKTGWPPRARHSPTVTAGAHHGGLTLIAETTGSPPRGMNSNFNML